MTDQEFDILDELYFVTSYSDMLGRVSIPKDELDEMLIGLFEKGWIRVFSSPDDTLDFEVVNRENLDHSFLLASKTGLKAHNSQ